MRWKILSCFASSTVSMGIDGRCSVFIRLLSKNMCCFFKFLLFLFG